MASSSSSRGKESLTRRILDASFSGNLKLLSKLGKELDDGEVALTSVKDQDGRVALHYAASGGRTQVCKYLIERLKTDANVKDDKGSTPLHLAIIEEQHHTFVYLLDHGAQPNVASCDGVTALHYAAEKGQKEQMNTLIAKGAEVDAQSFRGTPLQCAAANGKKNAVKILLDNHANPNSVNHQIFTPLMLAVVADSVDCVRLLLKAGADPNMVSHGLFPLILAASDKQSEIIRLLLKAGANANATNFHGFTAIEVAAMKGSHKDVMALFDATSRISYIPDWSCRGILEYVNSDEAKKQRNLKAEDKFLEAKAKGAEAVKRSDYLDAIYWYTEALNIKPLEAAVLSNRSMCWARLNEGENALEDAKSCIMLRREWPKAHYRAGVAWKILGDCEKATAAFNKGLMLDPENKELKNACREIEMEQIAGRLHSLCADKYGFNDVKVYYSTGACAAEFSGGSLL